LRLKDLNGNPFDEIAEDPAQSGSLPFIMPRSNLAQGPRFSGPNLFFDFRRGLERTFPNVALNGPTHGVLGREALFLDDSTRFV
jgi:hypothetical protein